MHRNAPSRERLKGYIHYASQQAATRLTTHVAAPTSHFVNAPATLGDVQHVEDFFGALADRPAAQCVAGLCRGRCVATMALE